jgi:hypothetical protein
MDTTGCITNEMWEQYAAGKLTTEQRSLLQQHAMGCELCADIKEGIDAMADPALLSQKVAAINMEVDHRIPKPKPEQQWMIFVAAAATLIIATGLGWHLCNNQNPPVALQEEKQEQVIAPQTTSSDPVVNDTEVSTEKTVKSVEHKKANIPLRALKEPEQSNEDIPKIALSDNLLAASETAKVPADKALTEEKETDDAASGTDKESSLPPIPTVIQTEATSAKSNKKRKTETYPAPYNNNNVSNNNYNQGGTANDTLIASRGIMGFADSPDRENYDKAVQHFNAMRYDSCHVYLNYVLLNKQGQHYEDALILLAQTQLKEDKTKEAKSTLQQVISLKGSRTEEARKLLKSLK